MPLPSLEEAEQEWQSLQQQPQQTYGFYAPPPPPPSAAHFAGLPSLEDAERELQRQQAQQHRQGMNGANGFKFPTLADIEAADRQQATSGGSRMLTLEDLEAAIQQSAQQPVQQQPANGAGNGTANGFKMPTLADVEEAIRQSELRQNQQQKKGWMKAQPAPPQQAQQSPEPTLDQRLYAGGDPVKAADEILKSGELKGNPEAENYVRLTRARERYRQAGVDKIEGEHEWWAQRVPFLGGLKTMLDIGYLLPAVRRIREGEGTDQDFNEVAQHQLMHEHLDQRTGFGQRVADIVTQLPAFGLEFAASGGLGKMGLQALKYGVGKAGREAAEKAALEAAEAYAKKSVMGKIGSSVGRAVGQQAVAQTIAAPTTTGGAIAKQLLPDIQEERGDDNQPQLKIGEDKGVVGAAAKGFLDSYITHASERLGQAFGESAAAIRGAIKPEHLDKLPIGQKLKDFIVQRYLSKNPNLNPDSFFKRLQDVGYNGILNEMLEERADEIAKGATGINPDYGTSGKLASGHLGAAARDLAIEAAAFAVPSGAAHVYDRFAGAPGHLPAQPGQATPQQPSPIPTQAPSGAAALWNKVFDRGRRATEPTPPPSAAVTPQWAKPPAGRKRGQVQYFSSVDRSGGDSDVPSLRRRQPARHPDRELHRDQQFFFEQ